MLRREVGEHLKNRKGNRPCNLGSGWFKDASIANAFAPKVGCVRVAGKTVKIKLKLER